MSKEEEFIAFLEDKIATARSIRANAAYTLVLDKFLDLYSSKGVERNAYEEQGKDIVTTG